MVRRKWPEGFTCPRCGHNEAYVMEKRRVYQCKRCRHQTSLTAKTLFHKTRKPAIFLVTTRTTGSSAHYIQRDLALSYPIAWSWCHKIRKAIQDRDTSYTLRGIVELDDSYIGGKKKPGKRGRGSKGKVHILMAVERRPEGCRHISLQKVDGLSIK